MSIQNVVVAHSSPSPANNEEEFRSYSDDAWYSVLLALEGEKLRVKYCGMYEESVFEVGQFKSLEELETFQRRFRPVSLQLQDEDCHKVSEGSKVCASHSFVDNDVRFYDAVVEHVIRKKHSFADGKEQCLCSFILHWQHGPHVNDLMEKKVENICFVQSNGKLNPCLASFMKIARQKIEGAAQKHVSGSDGVVVTSNSSGCHDENGSLHVKQKSTFAQLYLQHKSANRSPASFVKIARQKIEGAAYEHVPGSDGVVATSTNSGCHDENVSPSVKQESTSAQLYLQHKSAKRSPGNIKSHERKIDDLCERDRQDDDVGGDDNGYYAILIENLEKELAPSTIIDFIYQQTKITCQVYVFPCLSYELYACGAIVLDFKTDYVYLYKFLNNPDHIVVSLRGRPWVVSKTFSRHDLYRVLSRSIMLTSQKELKNRGAGISQEIRIVRKGTEEYRTAKKLKDLFMEFTTHQLGLYKRLALEEREISQPSPAM